MLVWVSLQVAARGVIIAIKYAAAACAQNAARCPAGFATDVLARLTALSASDLIESISLPVASYDHETHIGEDWLCGGNVHLRITEHRLECEAKWQLANLRSDLGLCCAFVARAHIRYHWLWWIECWRQLLSGMQHWLCWHGYDICLPEH